MTLAALLTHLRTTSERGPTAAGFGVASAARAIGINRRTLFRWEAGTRSPTHDDLLLLLDAYGATGEQRVEAERLRRAGVTS